ncbi:MCE family protein [Nocardioides ginsengisoli]|uniref:MCE family protein n=1 Tax=Nocardioides ginsengisoli TaxID=363868 RepID=A0ABW3W023_9ACTN
MTSSTPRRLLVLALVAVVAATGLVGVRMLRASGLEIHAEFASSVGLYPGSDVEILGVPVGRVTRVEPGPEHVLVTMRLDRGRRVGADTKAVVVAPTLVSDRYVQLTEPYDGGRALADGATITQTAVPVEIDQLYQSMVDLSTELGPRGANKDGALTRFLQAVAANLKGQGGDINTMLREFGKASATLSGVDDPFFATIDHLEALNATLLDHDSGVADANRQFATVAASLAADRDDLSRAVDNLGRALAGLHDFVRDSRAQLRRSVQRLQGPTQLLVKHRRSLEEAVADIPLALQNFLRAYDPGSNTVQGRGDLNELTAWSRDGLSGRTSEHAPPVLVPGTGGAR